MRLPKYLIMGIICSIIIACSNDQSKAARELEKIINNSLNVALFDSISSGPRQISFYDFRKQHEFISVVFLQEGCAPCYPKFVEWHKKMESIDVHDNYTTLFVINARNYKQFIDGAIGYELIDDKYYHVVDPENRFLGKNSEVPRWIIDRSLLIDTANRIKLIGAPYVTEDMTKVFHSIIGVTQLSQPK